MERKGDLIYKFKFLEEETLEEYQLSLTLVSNQQTLTVLIVTKYNRLLIKTIYSLSLLLLIIGVL